jgi:hypothetical protein
MLKPFYKPAPGRTAQILRESAIESRAIIRHQREAILQGRSEEAREMEILCSGISRIVLEATQPYQQANAA